MLSCGLTFVAGLLVYVLVSIPPTLPIGASGVAPPRATPPAPAPAEYTLTQYPDAGFTGLYAQTADATHSINMEMYELADTTEEAALVAAKQRGVAVTVLLDSAYSGRSVNAAAFKYLTANAVPVRWAPSGRIFHIKTIVFDQDVADVSTANLTSRYYSTTRDAMLIDRNPAQVAAITTTLANDWAENTGPPAAAAGLVWSPGSESALAQQISSARTSIDFTSEELSDPAIYDALAGDARRGVTCKVVMTASSEWAKAFAVVTAAGCQVHVLANRSTALYEHEKEILTDAGTANGAMLLGSQNASYTSLTRNRELGVVVTAAQAPTVIVDAAATFTTDYTSAQPWQAHG